MTIEEMRTLLGLGPEISDAEVANLYAAWLLAEVGAPAVSAITLLPLDLVKKQLRVDHDDEDELITAYIEAAVGHIDGPTGWLGRAVRVQSLVHRVDRFTADPIALPYPPLIEVDSVKYIDTDGVEQTVDPASYEVFDGKVLLASGASWPATKNRIGAVSVTYQAGYLELPPAMRSALLLMVTDLYEHRGSAVVGTIAAEVPMSLPVERMLGPFRVFA